MLTNIHLEKHRNLPVLDPDLATTRRQKEKAGKTHLIQVQAQCVAGPMLATQVCHCKGIRKRSVGYGAARMMAVSLVVFTLLSSSSGWAQGMGIQSLDTGSESRSEKADLTRLASQSSPPVEMLRTALRGAYREIV
ncbi:MAG: hypothetical protein KJ645_10565, partial [Planctomycetes bacterium]|nr:hypothetical protein [Planctomycetota bacterium]